jgi:hypothetical protein
MGLDGDSQAVCPHVNGDRAGVERSSICRMSHAGDLLFDLINGLGQQVDGSKQLVVGGLVGSLIQHCDEHVKVRDGGAIRNRLAILAVRTVG